MRSQRLALGLATAALCLGVSGCGNGGTHQVLLGLQASVGHDQLQYTINDNAPQTVTSQTSSAGDSVATVSLRLKTGTHVAIAGSETTPASPALTCTITVDGVVKATQIEGQPTTGSINTPLQCGAAMYVGHRPYGVGHVLAIAAFLLSLLIVVGALGSLVVSRRRA